MSATFSAQPVIWIHVEDPTGDLVLRFQRWMAAAPGRYVARGCSTSTGFLPSTKVISIFRGGFAVDVAELAIEWLKQNGARPA